MRFFTSDTHFGHQGILKYEADIRKFDTTDDMDEYLIEAWNSVVGPEDVVIHLGDVAMGKIADSLPKIGRANGIKYLVPGNHDRVFSGNKPGMAERFDPEYRQVFRDIFSEQTTMTLADGTLVKLCHFPYQGDHTEEDRYADKRPFDDGQPLIHGHVHSLWRTNGRQFNVGIDVHNLAPVAEDVIIEWVRSL